MRIQMVRINASSTTRTDKEGSPLIVSWTESYARSSAEDSMFPPIPMKRLDQQCLPIDLDHDV